MAPAAEAAEAIPVDLIATAEVVVAMAAAVVAAATPTGM